MMLSNARPTPSMLIAIPAALRTPVNASLVNWLPWSVLKIAGRRPVERAASRA